MIWFIKEGQELVVVVLAKKCWCQPWGWYVVELMTISRWWIYQVGRTQIAPPRQIVGFAMQSKCAGGQCDATHSGEKQRTAAWTDKCWTDKCRWISSLPTWLPTFPPTSHPSLPTYICSDIRSSLRYESHLAPYLPSHYPPIPTNLYQLFTLWKFEAFSTHWVWVPNLVSNKNKRITSNYDCSKKKNK